MYVLKGFTSINIALLRCIAHTKYVVSYKGLNASSFFWIVFFGMLHVSIIINSVNRNSQRRLMPVT